MTADGKRSAQFEHTILVTETGFDILTARTNNSVPFWWDIEQTQNETEIENENVKKFLEETDSNNTHNDNEITMETNDNN